MQLLITDMGIYLNKNKNKYNEIAEQTLSNIDPKYLLSCNQLNDSKILMEIINIYKASNHVYEVKIDKTKIYKTDNIYIDGKIDTLALKYCSLDKATCTFIANAEIEAIIKLSKLVVNNICNSYMLFLGFTNNCSIEFINKKKEFNNELIVDEDSSIIITNFVKNSKHISDIDDRQLFEYLYCIICCIANYELVIGDRHLENFLSYDDGSGIVYEIFNNKFYFPSNKGFYFIDYQSTIKMDKIDGKYNISTECEFMKQCCKNKTTFDMLQLQQREGTILELLNSLMTNFHSYSCEKLQLNEYKNIKKFTFAVLEN